MESPSCVTFQADGVLGTFVVIDTRRPCRGLRATSSGHACCTDYSRILVTLPTIMCCGSIASHASESITRDQRTRVRARAPLSPYTGAPGAGLARPACLLAPPAVSSPRGHGAMTAWPTHACPKRQQRPMASTLARSHAHDHDPGSGRRRGARPAGIGCPGTRCVGTSWPTKSRDVVLSQGMWCVLAC